MEQSDEVKPMTVDEVAVPPEAKVATTDHGSPSATATGVMEVTAAPAEASMATTGTRTWGWKTLPSTE